MKKERSYIYLKYTNERTWVIKGIKKEKGKRKKSEKLNRRDDEDDNNDHED